MQAGSDGLSFEPMLPLKPVVARHDRTHCMISSKAGARTLTFGSKEQVRSEIGATLAVASDCRGFICAVGQPTARQRVAGECAVLHGVLEGALREVRRVRV